MSNVWTQFLTRPLLHRLPLNTSPREPLICSLETRVGRPQIQVGSRPVHIPGKCEYDTIFMTVFAANVSHDLTNIWTVANNLLICDVKFVSHWQKVLTRLHLGERAFSKRWTRGLVWGLVLGLLQGLRPLPAALNKSCLSFLLSLKPVSYSMRMRMQSEFDVNLTSQPSYRSDIRKWVEQSWTAAKFLCEFVTSTFVSHSHSQELWTGLKFLS